MHVAAAESRIFSLLDQRRSGMGARRWNLRGNFPDLFPADSRRPVFQLGKPELGNIGSFTKLDC
jgi:hypothetical protein